MRDSQDELPTKKQKENGTATKTGYGKPSDLHSNETKYRHAVHTIMESVKEELIELTSYMAGY